MAALRSFSARRQMFTSLGTKASFIKTALATSLRASWMSWRHKDVTKAFEKPLKRPFSGLKEDPQAGDLQTPHSFEGRSSGAHSDGLGSCF